MPKCDLPVGECPENWFFNTLACQCLNTALCEIGCPPGQKVSPDSSCTCQSYEYVRNLFPADATEEMILKSMYWSPFPDAPAGDDGLASICWGKAKAPEGFDWG